MDNFSEEDRSTDGHSSMEQAIQGGERTSDAADYWIAECKKRRPPIGDSALPSLRIADLFSGCGGLTLGAAIACQQLGHRLEIAVAADCWRDAIEVYESNFSAALARHATALVEDLSTFVPEPGAIELSERGTEIADAAGVVDVVLAGPPCQGHSDLNNSSRRDDPRNSLYTIPVAFGLHTKAKLILIENVPTVVHSTDGVVDSALDVLGKEGYAVAEYVADAQDFGLPQTRKRHLLIASKLHSKEALSALLQRIPPRKKDVALWSFIEDLENEPESPDNLLTKRSKISPDNVSRIDYLFNSNVFDLPNALRPSCHRDKTHSYVSMYGRLRPNLPAPTITSGFGSMGQGRFVHPTQRRMITPHEAARIQGFPDYFKFSAAKKLTAVREMIGNAVAPPVAAVLLNLLLSK